MQIFDDLGAEEERLDEILSGLTEADWLSPSAASGWTITDVVLHLAQSEEAVVASVAGQAGGLAANAPAGPETGGLGADASGGPGTVEDLMDRMVRAERAAPSVVFARWRTARRTALGLLREADPSQRLAWVAAPLKPATLATTRLAEHWAHGLDITGPLGIDFPDTDRLRHVAWLAHGTLGYAFTLAGRQPQPVFCELTAPDGTGVWRFGPSDAPSTITGPAGEFCRVAAQRLDPATSTLRATGPHGATALGVLRTYAA